MKLLRIWDGLRKLNKGPCADGFFMALKDYEDLPDSNKASEHDVEMLLENGDLYIGNAERQNKTWQKVESVKDIEDVDFTGTHRSDYEGCYDYYDVSPYMPELYYVPRNARGKRHMRRSKNRNHNLYRLRGWKN